MNGINPILLIYAVGLHSVVGMIHKAIKLFFATVLPFYSVSVPTELAQVQSGRFGLPENSDNNSDIVK